MTTICYKGLGLEVEFTPASPGRLYGPPERCYEPEGASIEIEDIWIEDTDAYEEHFGPVVREDYDFLASLLDNDEDREAITERCESRYDDDRYSYNPREDDEFFE
jgi:hypothetical protein